MCRAEGGKELAQESFAAGVVQQGGGASWGEVECHMPSILNPRR